MGFKRVRTLPEWQDYFPEASFQVLRAQGICLVEEPGHEAGTVLRTVLVFVTNAKREGRWLLPRRDRSNRFK